ncbi:MAG: adenylate/guanylate cyclase domain-containing protein [Deltaproteobacteria bacterium]|nr:adenylate/guanylate cyclase domain-containing protein [Deltaproteobacteria bacterium]
MNPRTAQLLRVGIALLAALIGWGLGETGHGAALDALVYDRFFIWRGATPPPGELVLVTVDELTLRWAESTRGRPLILRKDNAELVDKLYSAGAEVVAFDYLLELVNDDPEHDQALVEALARHPSTVFASYFTKVDALGVKQTRHVPPARRFGDVRHGLANVVADGDRVVRSLKPSVTIAGRTHYALAVMAVATYQRKPPAEVIAAIPDSWYRPDDPTALRVHFTGPKGTIPSVPYHQVMQNVEAINRELLEGKIVLIGVDHVRAKSSIATPFVELADGEREGSGVDVHANMIATLLHGGIRHFSRWGRLPICLAAALGLAVLGRRLRPRLIVGSAALVAVAWTAVAFLAFAHRSTWLGVITPMAALAAIAAALGTVQRILRARARTASHSRLKPVQWAALAVIDMAHSTRIGSTFGDSFAAAHKSRLRHLALPHAESQDCLFYKGMGDGLLLAFSSIQAATSACEQALRAVGDDNTDREAEDELHVRMAIHVGEIRRVMVGKLEDIEGDAVNLVCRIEGIQQDALIEDDDGIAAEQLPEQDRILLSEPAFRQESKRCPEATTRFLGFVDLKGIAGRQRLYELEIDQS